MKETFSPYSARFITLKTCILPPLLIYTNVLSSNTLSESLSSFVSPVAQGVLVFGVEIIAIWGTKKLNENARKKKLLDNEDQISDLRKLIDTGMDPSSTKEAQTHIKKLNAETVKLTATRF